MWLITCDDPKPCMGSVIFSISQRKVLIVGLTIKITLHLKSEIKLVLVEIIMLQFRGSFLYLPTDKWYFTHAHGIE